MRQIFVFIVLALLSGSIKLSAQELKHWTISLSAMYGEVVGGDKYRRESAMDHNRAYAILPGVQYHITRHWSAGLYLLLPLREYSTFRKDELTVYTTGGGLFLRYGLPLFKRFRISLDLGASGGLVGPYKWVEVLPIGAPPPWRPRYKNPYKGMHYRWQVGLSPSISYQLSDHWGLEMSCGFWGYFSNKDLEHPTYRVRNDPEKRDGFGFSAEVGRGTALRLGLTYSF